MMPLDEVLIQFAVVGGLSASEVVGNIGLLKQDVAVILLVVQNFANGLNMPHGIPSRRGDPVFFQLRRDRAKRQAIFMPCEDRADDLRSCRVGDQVPVLVLHVAVADTVGKAGTAVVEPHPKTPTDRRALVFTLVLEKARVNGQEPDGVGIVDVQPFYLKEHVHAEAVQLSAGLQKLDGVPSQTADRLDKDQVDLAVAAVPHHPLKVFHLLVMSAGRLIRIHADKDPVHLFGDLVREVFFLYLPTMILDLLFGADPTVCRHAFGADHIGELDSRADGDAHKIRPPFFTLCITIVFSRMEVLFCRSYRFDNSGENGGEILLKAAAFRTKRDNPTITP